MNKPSIVAASVPLLACLLACAGCGGGKAVKPPEAGKPVETAKAPAAPAAKGEPKPAEAKAGAVAHAEALGKAEIVVIGECLGYYPRSHLEGISCECMVGGVGRLPVRADEILKGAELAGEARELQDRIGSLPGHAAHELPELRTACGDKTFLFLRPGKAEGGQEGLERLDASFKGKKGIWLLRLGHEKKGLDRIRASGRVSPDVLLDWIFEWEFLETSEEAKVREALAAGGK
jgi:hypothetical protein